MALTLALLAFGFGVFVGVLAAVLCFRRVLSNALHDHLDRMIAKLWGWESRGGDMRMPALEDCLRTGA